MNVICAEGPNVNSHCVFGDENETSFLANYYRTVCHSRSHHFIGNYFDVCHAYANGTFRHAANDGSLRQHDGQQWLVWMQRHAAGRSSHAAGIQVFD